LDAKWFVVRDASSEEREDALLNGMLQAVGLRREQIYIVNGMTNQPKILQNEIERIQPSVILVMGEKMAQVLLNRQETLSVLRTQPVNTGSIPTVVTFSTAYLLKKPLAKRLAWHDLQRAQQFVLE
jgi:DNA polymerase